MSLIEVGTTSFLEVVWTMFRMPVLNFFGAAAAYVLDDEGYIDFDEVSFKNAAIAIIGFKWIHTFIAEALRLWVANNDLTYTGDLMSATYVNNEVTTLDSTFFGTAVNVYFLLPFLNQAYKREQFYEFLPALLTWPLDSVLMLFGIDIQYELRSMATTVTGILGAVEPFNDLFMMAILLLTDNRSFLGDPLFFTTVCAYIPMVMVSLAWFANQMVMVYKDPFDQWPVSKFLMDSQQFVYMVYPTYLVYLHYFV